MVSVIEFTSYAASVDQRNQQRLTWLLDDLESAIADRQAERALHVVQLGARSGVLTRGEAQSLRARIKRELIA